MVDCLIVGGGVIGLSLAWQLALRGRKVRVLDRQEIGREASWAGAGILPPASRLALTHPYDQLRGLSFNLHEHWAELLRSQTGIDTGYRRCGGIYLARSAGEGAALTAWATSLAEEGVEVERLGVRGDKETRRQGDLATKLEKLDSPCPLVSLSPGPRELKDLEPQLARCATPFRSAWLLPDECQLRNPRYLQALASVCESNGVEISANCEVLDWKLENGRAATVTSQGSLSAEQICVTSGAWTGTLLQKLGLTLGVIPIRGQMVLFRSEQPVARAVINEGSRYLVPRDDGRLLAGSTEEEAGFEKTTTEEGIRELIAFAVSLLPALRSAAIEQTWAGLRPASFDGFPYLGAIPGIANGFVAAGHFRSGLYLSPGTAVVMAQLMCGEKTEIDLTPFRVGR